MVAQLVGELCPQRLFLAHALRLATAQSHDHRHRGNRTAAQFAPCEQPRLTKPSSIHKIPAPLSIYATEIEKS
jgi:hypothetical protein